MRCGIAHWALAAVLVTLETSSACSVDRAYIPLTNYELVKITPAIVVTRATGTELRAVSIAVGVDRLRKHVRFEIVEVLKSASLEVGTALTLAGTIEDYQGRGAANDFSSPRPGAYVGSCVAFDYQLGSHSLLFLDEIDGAWRVSGWPFARVNEEIDLQDDAWLTAIRHYTQIAALDSYPAETKALHQRWMEEHARHPTGSLPSGLVADIQNHFSRATPD